MDNIICVVGPTASGKTKLAVRLAQELNGEVISCDSMQLYRGMDIGTAKPTREEMQGVVHHMLDVADPWEDFSAGKYVEMADPIVQDILSRGKTCIVAGGTGLYVDSLMAGRSFAPVPSTGRREALEREADAQGTGPLLARLAVIDPETAARLHPADRKRIIRALEVFEETGETLSAHDRRTREQPPRYTPCRVGLDFQSRADLYARIDLRVELMLQAGLLDEIEALLRAGIDRRATAMQAIGYKEFLAAMDAGTDLHEAAELVKQRSRNYAKRQLTWFRRNEQTQWILQPAQPDFEWVFAQARRIIPFFAR